MKITKVDIWKLRHTSAHLLLGQNLKPVRTTWAKISCYYLLGNKCKRSRHFQFTWKWSRGHSTLQKIPPIHRLGLRPGLEQKVRKEKKHWKAFFFGISPVLRGSPWIDVIQRIDRAVTNKYPSIITFILRMGCYSQKTDSIERGEIALLLFIYSSFQNGHLLLNECS